MAVEKITIQELVRRMREMEPGTSIDLHKGDSVYIGWFGIRRLRDNLFFNGRNWIADYYGGGHIQAFCDDPDDDYGVLTDRLAEWLYGNGLVTTEGLEEIVKVRNVDTVPEPEQKNRMVCMKFYTMHPHAVYVSIPPTMSDADACELTRQRLSELDEETFRSIVINGEDGEPWDPWPEDFIDMDVDPECNQQSADFTDKPTGTLGR